MAKLIQMINRYNHEHAYRFQITLSFGVSSYVLPKVDAEFRGAYCGGLRLFNKEEIPQDSEDQSFDFEIKDGEIKFTPHFTSVLDFEGEEIVDLVYARRLNELL